MEDRIYIFFVNQSIFRCKQRCVKNNIGTKSTAFRLILMKRSAIDENAASFRQFYPVVSGKTYYRTFVDKQEFQFMVPMPVNPMKIKFPNIFRIKGERVCLAPVDNSLPQSIIRINFMCIRKSPYCAQIVFAILYHKQMIKSTV